MQIHLVWSQNYEAERVLQENRTNRETCYQVLLNPRFFIDENEGLRVLPRG